MTYNDLSQLLEQRNISKMEFSRITGIAPQIITNAKKRGGHFSATTMEKMKDFLNENKISESALTYEEFELLKLFRNAEDMAKEIAVDTLRNHQKKEAYSNSLKEA